jgi:hypothetical protein
LVYAFYCGQTLLPGAPSGAVARISREMPFAPQALFSGTLREFEAK